MGTQRWDLEADIVGTKTKMGEWGRHILQTTQPLAVCTYNNETDDRVDKTHIGISLVH